MGFIARRLAITVLTLLLVTILSFSAFRLIPGDAALIALGLEATEAQVQALRAELGLDRSFPAQYLMWLGNFLSGNLGNSTRFMGVPIADLILQRLPVTIALAGLSFLLILLISIPVTLLSVKKENSLADRVVTTLTALSISIPGFFLSLLFIWIFGLTFRLFVPGAFVSFSSDPVAFFAYLFFPALAIALPNSALVIKFLRSSIFREFQADYARTALSKGADRSHVLHRHVLKNACLPAITLFGMITGDILSGSIVIEQVFGIPGIGMLLLTSITARDFPLIQTLIVYIAFAVVLANTLADIVLQIIDPRIRLAGKV
ncbi:MAG: ABC transporter permease [Treponema sp.]|jgi:ABC-type dipeptide/oligopeptide/nickel transport system permease component|nr:ABC transporter permease [Treponema sp.]